MAGRDVHARSILWGALKPMPLARVDEVRRILDAEPEALGAAKRVVGVQDPALTAKELERLASRCWRKVPAEERSAIARIAKALIKESDPVERRERAVTFARRTCEALFAVESLLEGLRPQEPPDDPSTVIEIDVSSAEAPSPKVRAPAVDIDDSTVIGIDVDTPAEETSELEAVTQVESLDPGQDDPLDTGSDTLIDPLDSGTVDTQADTVDPAAANPPSDPDPLPATLVSSAPPPVSAPSPRRFGVLVAGLALIGVALFGGGFVGYWQLGLGDPPRSTAAATEEPSDRKDAGTRDLELIELEPKDNSELRTRQVDVRGRVQGGQAGAKIRIAGILRTLDGNGRFELKNLALEEGVNLVPVALASPRGGTLRKVLRISVDTVPPRLEVVSPPTDRPLFEERVVLEVRVHDQASRVVALVRGREVEVLRGEKLSERVRLAIGENVIVLRATDPAGNTGETRVTLRRHSQVPGWFRQLPTSRRPALPLPGAVRIGEGPGEYVNIRDGSVMVWIPAATFQTGSDSGDPDERPRRRVSIRRGYFMGKYEVTWAQFHRFCLETGRPLIPRVITYKGESFAARKDHPVTRITWDDAHAYCAWAGLRLPTEVEWELAARGTDSRKYPWGNEAPGTTRANLGVGGWGDVRDRRDGFAYTSPVGAFPRGASPFGCLGMAGNVKEWVEDWYSAPSVERRRFKVLRGGSWRHAPREGRAANRSYHERSGDPVQHCGFRVCR